MKVSVLCCAWNQVHLTYQFLYGIKKYVGKDVEVLIFNNGSQDATPELLASWEKTHKWLKFYSSLENLGFAAANNILAQNSFGDYLIFINNDVLIDGDFISPLITPLEEDPNQIVGANLYDWPTGWNEFTTATGEPIIVPYIGGWCLAITKENFAKLNGFWEEYGLADFEDVHMCKAAVEAGMKLRQAQIPVKHLSGQTAVQLPDRNALTLKNREIFKKRWGLQ